MIGFRAVNRQSGDSTRKSKEKTTLETYFFQAMNLFHSMPASQKLLGETWGSALDSARKQDLAIDNYDSFKNRSSLRRPIALALEVFETREHARAH